jgi:quinol monooxygenase YgiN
VRVGVGDQEMAVVLAHFRAAIGNEGQVAGVLSRYVVVSRGHEGCLNIDLLESEAQPHVFVVIQKWASEEDRDRHFSSDDAVLMAESMSGLLSEPPQISPFAPVSAHDLL